MQQYLKKLMDEIITDEILSLILICSVDFDESIFSLKNLLDNIKTLKLETLCPSLNAIIWILSRFLLQ